MSFQRVTKNGYVLGEVSSAVQKEIRRGNEEGAMYWALEMCPQFEQYLWRRLLVIVNEDIGLANLEVVMFVSTQRQTFLEMRERGDGAPLLVLGNTILAMCRSPKSRLVDFFATTVWQDKLKGPRRDIPDYAIDKHTRRGKEMGRGLDFWLKDGCVIKPISPEEFCKDTNEYAERAIEHWRNAHNDWVDERWPKRGKGGEDEEPLQPNLI